MDKRQAASNGGHVILTTGMPNKSSHAIADVINGRQQRFPLKVASGGHSSPRGGGGGSTSTGTCSDDEDGASSSCSLEETAAKLEVALRGKFKGQQGQEQQSQQHEDGSRHDFGQ